MCKFFSHQININDSIKKRKFKAQTTLLRNILFITFRMILYENTYQKVGTGLCSDEIQNVKAF
jgi:hypothetical protein